MTRRSSGPATATDNPPWSGEPARRWLLAGVAALWVARPLLPRELPLTGEGLIFVMLWLTLLVGWALRGLLKGGLEVRWGPTEIAVGFLVGGYTLSAVIAGSQGAPRAASNMLWEFIGLAVGFFLTRQLVTSNREARALVAGLSGLAVALAVYGIYQYSVEMPATRQMFEQAEDQGEFVRANGLTITPESAAWDSFVQRLYSHEPYATFSLANSLAGFLVPWLLVLAGILLSLWTRKPTDQASQANQANQANQASRLSQSPFGRSPAHPESSRKRTGQEKGDPRWRLVCLGVSLGLLLLLACLVLTKSRSAWAAMALGLVLLGWLSRREWAIRAGSPPWAASWSSRWVWGSWIIAGVGLGGVLLAIGLTGVVDWEVFSEAWKSFSYRLQYWQGAGQIIAERPLWGCGPGQFQDHYMRFKAATASEEVLDPHNWLVEMAATAGLPNLLLLFAGLAAFAWQLFRSPCQAEGERQPDRDASRSIALGVLLGAPLAFLGGLTYGYVLSPRLVVGVITGLGLCLGFLWPWVEDGRLPRRVVCVALVGLGVNLLAAGGLSFPGVIGTGWMLLALGLTLSQLPPAGSEQRPPRKWVAVVWSVVSLGLLAACYLTAYLPVSSSRMSWQQAQVVSQSGFPSGSASQRELAETQAARVDQFLTQAAQADPLNPWPAEQLAELALRKWESQPQERLWREFVFWSEQYLRARGPSAESHLQIGLWYRRAAEATSYQPLHEVFRAEEVQWLSLAVQWYPNSPQHRGELARSQAAAGDRQAAAVTAQQALDLSDRTPHQDKKLSGELYQLLQRITTAPDQAG